MREVVFSATEIQDAKVGFVALVKRGANRLPFRIVKNEDEDMIDLHKIGRALFAKSAVAAGPQVVAAIVPAGADTDRLAALFKEAGLDPTLFTKTDPADGVVTLTKSDAEGSLTAEDTAVLKTDGDVALVVTGLKKAFDGWGAAGSDFATAISAQGFYPAFSTAREVLNEVVHANLQKSNSPAEASTAIAKSIDDFKSYMTTLAGALPESAFYVDRWASNYLKAEAPVAQADIVKTETPAEPVAVEKSEAPVAEGEPAAAEPKAEAVEKAEEPAQAPADNAATGDTGAQVAAMQKSLEAIAETLKTGMTEALDVLSKELRTELSKVSDEVAALDKRVRKTDEAISGTVFADTPGDHQPVRVSKSEAGTPPLLDTAYSRAS